MRPGQPVQTARPVQKLPHLVTIPAHGEQIVLKKTNAIQVLAQINAYLGVSKDRPRYRNSLPLSTAELASLLSNWCIISAVKDHMP